MARIWHHGNRRFLGNPGGIYSPNRYGKIIHDPKPIEKKKKLGKAFVSLSKDLYLKIMEEIKNNIRPDWKSLNKKYNIYGSFNFYNDLRNNNIEYYKSWFPY